MPDPQKLFEYYCTRSDCPFGWSIEQGLCTWLYQKSLSENEDATMPSATTSETWHADVTDKLDSGNNGDILYRFFIANGIQWIRQYRLYIYMYIVIKWFVCMIYNNDNRCC